MAERGAAQPRRVLVPVDDQELRLIKTLLQVRAAHACLRAGGRANGWPACGCCSAHGERVPTRPASGARPTAQFLMPRLLGFDEMFNGPPTMPDASGTGGAPAAGGGAPF